MQSVKHFGDRLKKVVYDHGPCCVGIDPHMHLLPRRCRPTGRASHFLEPGCRPDPDTNLEVADAICDWAFEVLDVVKETDIGIVKPQAAFFEQWGLPGVDALISTVHRARELGLLVILDAKRGDIGSTARAYVQATLGQHLDWAPDAVTLSPYLGYESLEPWVDHVFDNPYQGVFILLRTSNPGAEDWQISFDEEGIAYRVQEFLENCWSGDDARELSPFGAVLGATLPRSELYHWRGRLPQTWFLAPGYGAQGAKAEDLRPLFREDGFGAIIPASRTVLFGDAAVPEEGDWKAALQERVLAFKQDVNRVWRG